MKETFATWQEYQDQAQNQVTKYEAVHWNQFFNVLQRLRSEVQQLKDRVAALETRS